MQASRTAGRYIRPAPAARHLQCCQTPAARQQQCWPYIVCIKRGAGLHLRLNSSLSCVVGMRRGAGMLSFSRGGGQVLACNPMDPSSPHVPVRLSFTHSLSISPPPLSLALSRSVCLDVSLSVLFLFLSWSLFLRFFFSFFFSSLSPSSSTLPLSHTSTPLTHTHKHTRVLLHQGCAGWVIFSLSCAFSLTLTNAHQLSHTLFLSPSLCLPPELEKKRKAGSWILWRIFANTPNL